MTLELIINHDSQYRSVPRECAQVEEAYAYYEHAAKTTAAIKVATSFAIKLLQNSFPDAQTDFADLWGAMADLLEDELYSAGDHYQQLLEAHALPLPNIREKHNA